MKTIVYALRYHKNHAEYPGYWCTVDYASGGYLIPTSTKICCAKFFWSKDQACSYLYANGNLELVELKIEEIR